MPLYDYRCPRCGNVEEHVVKHDAVVTCLNTRFDPKHKPAGNWTCGEVMERLDSAPLVRVGMGFTADSRAAYNKRIRAQQEAKGRAFDKTTEGQQQRAEALRRQMKNGNLLGTKG